jgi:hypothetical protein
MHNLKPAGGTQLIEIDRFESISRKIPICAIYCGLNSLSSDSRLIYAFRSFLHAFFTQTNHVAYANPLPRVAVR